MRSRVTEKSWTVLSFQANYDLQLPRCLFVQFVYCRPYIIKCLVYVYVEVRRYNTKPSGVIQLKNPSIGHRSGILITLPLGDHTIVGITSREASCISSNILQQMSDKKKLWSYFLLRTLQFKAWPQFQHYRGWIFKPYWDSC